MANKTSRRRAPSAAIKDPPDSRDVGDAARAISSFPIVGIGASAGGLEAFTELLSHLPPDIGMAFVLVQHLDPQHESALTKLLARATSLPVDEVTDNLRVEANRVYVIPPNTSLAIAQDVLKLAPRPQTRAPTRSIDAFFESLAEHQRERAIGVILSGTATDGTLGLEAIKAEGGITFAQDESARYDSMPRSAVAAGCVDYVLSPANIANELARIAKHPYVAGQSAEPRTPEDDRASATAHEDDATPLPSGGHGTPDTGARKARAEAERGSRKAAAPKAVENGFRKILSLLRSHTGVDFSLYRSSTIQRRIVRRMVLCKQDDLQRYADFLRGNARELDTLYSDVLISVTSFFRNPEAFDVLKQKVFPKLFGQRGDDPLRVWVLGCSTGQEAYSIAMAFVEAADKAPRMHRLQVFATDLNDALLDKARHGLYARSLAEDVTPERLRRFFVEEEGGYRVGKPLRELVVFARQNLISDPPFSRMDLVSCRNLMIYLEPGLQKKLLPTFHYALKSGGFLFLGASESVAAFTDLFEPVDKKYKIYARKAAPTPAVHLPLRADRAAPPGRRPPQRLPIEPLETPGEPRAEPNAQREADRVTVSQFAPPGVLINADLQILQFRGPTGAFLQPPSGRATFDVLKMAREGLMLPLRAAINKAKKENRTARRENVRIGRNGASRTVNLEVIPLKNLRERCFLILFEDAETARRSGVGTALPKSGEQPAAPRKARAVAKEETRRIAELESDLTETRDYLQVLQEQHEAANEELQASNEEVQSANEELQSINEELETSKEELESANEELTTVNEEMANRNAELNRANSDLVNLQTSTRTTIVLLGRDLAIRRFSAHAEKQFGLGASDVGRPIGNIRHNLVFPPLGADAVPGGGAPDAGIDTSRHIRRATRGHDRGPNATRLPSDLEGFVAEVIDSVREREREVRDRDGHWYSLRVRPYFTLDNKVDGAVLVLVDIDKLKRAAQAIAEARDYAEEIVRTVRDPLLILNADLRVHAASNAFYAAFRMSPVEVEGHAIYELGNRQWDIPRLRELLADILPRNSFFDDFEVTLEVAGRGGRVMLVNARTLRATEGQPARVLLGIQDVTEQKESANALQRLSSELVDADRHKNEFLAVLAHELRNPLAPIRNALSIIRRTTQDRSVQPAVDMMERQVRQLVRLVDDLLDVSRISHGHIELRREQIDLASAVAHAVEAVRPQLDGMGHELTVMLPPRPLYVDADVSRIAQVVGNLLSNAGKFTDPGGRIGLNVERRGEEAVISVRDNGIGIAAEQLPRIFDMFTQVDTSMERTNAGLGIGLSLVRQLVALHGGSMDARSGGIGQGSEFIVRLPVGVAASTRRESEPNSELVRTAAAARILVVDDNRDAANSIATLLGLDGHEARTAFDGLEALEVAATFRPGVMLLDVGLPRMNGYEVARRIREQPWGKRIVLVAVTGWGSDADRQKSRDAGFDHHLVKPVDSNALIKYLAGLPPAKG